MRYRKQHLMERLSRRTDVMYVNPPRALKAREWPFRRRTRRVAPGLWVHEPFVMPGMRRRAGARHVTYRWLAGRLQRWCRYRPMILWLYSPHGLPFADLLRPDAVVYDVADLYATPSGAGIRDESERVEIETLARLEAVLLERADLTLCVSEPLFERLGRRTRRAHLVPNGCDWSLYAGAAPPATSGGRPRLGYIGSLAPRVDIGLIAAVAEARPDWTFEIVGPVLPLVDLSPLRGRPNVVLTGEIPYADVPGRIASFDVCLLPLLEIDFAYCCSPIQVFDYLGAGKPVVSTPVGQLETWNGLVRIARGVDEFVRAVELALGERAVPDVLRRREFAQSNSWDARVAQIGELLAQLGVSIGTAGAHTPRETVAA
jgi:UDP-galactopyranose mutase